MPAGRRGLAAAVDGDRRQRRRGGAGDLRGNAAAARHRRDAARRRTARHLSDRGRRSAGRRSPSQRARLDANPGDREALRTVRRGFHTLKGSGRMVGLTELGELAYDVEKILNRLLEEDRPVTPRGARDDRRGGIELPPLGRCADAVRAGVPTRAMPHRRVAKRPIAGVASGLPYRRADSSAALAPSTAAAGRIGRASMSSRRADRRTTSRRAPAAGRRSGCRRSNDRCRAVDETRRTTGEAEASSW